MVERALALEIKHGVHDVLEGLGPRDAAAFRHVSHEQHGGARLLREPHQTRRALPYLADVAGRAFEVIGVRRLNRVHEHDLRVEGARVVGDRLEPGFSQHVHGAGVEGEAVGAQPHLVGGLLPRDVQRADAGVLQTGGALQQQRGLPDAGLAPD